MIMHKYVEHVCEHETTLWNFGEEAKEKRLIESKILRYITFEQVKDITLTTESW
jgi:hypothetical protein